MYKKNDSMATYLYFLKLIFILLSVFVNPAYLTINLYNIKLQIIMMEENWKNFDFNRSKTKGTHLSMNKYLSCFDS